MNELIDTRKNDNYDKKHIKFFEAVIEKQVKIDNQTGKEYFDVVVASEKMDSMADVLLMSGAKLERFTKNPVVLYQHEADDAPIGLDLGLTIVGGELRGKMWLHEITKEAKEAKALIMANIIKCISIGFQIHAVEWQMLTQEEKAKLPNYYSEKRIITSWEMMEYSVVTLPANTDATIKSYIDGLNAKSATFNISDAIKELAEEVATLEIEEKAGATLSKKTKETLTKLKSLLAEANTHLDALTVDETDNGGVTEIKDLQMQIEALNVEIAELKAVNMKPKLKKLL